MEEVYIVKLKNLPPPSPSESLSKSDSFYYQTDLTAEAIRGFGFLHIFFGFTLLCLSVTNLCFHDNPLTLEPPLGITVWCSVAFILLGFASLLAAYKRKCDLPGSVLFVKLLFGLIVLTLSLTLSFAILYFLDLHGPISNQLIGLNILFSVVVEGVILLLSLFTTARILWPGCLVWCARDWPMQPTLKRKVIVKTNVFTNGIQQDDTNMIQSFGPNCVISLNMPTAASRGGSQLDVSPDGSPKSAISSGSSSSAMPVPRSLRAGSWGSFYGQSGEGGGSQMEQERHTQVATIYRGRAFDETDGKHTLQTFPSGVSQSNLTSTAASDTTPALYSNLNRLLYGYPTSTRNNALYREEDEEEEVANGARYNPTFFGDDLECHEEEEDLYDTDEFDYCSAEDDDVGSGDTDKASLHQVVVTTPVEVSPPLDQDDIDDHSSESTTFTTEVLDGQKELATSQTNVVQVTNSVASSVPSINLNKPREEEEAPAQGEIRGERDEDQASSTSDENLSLHDEGIGHSSGSSTCSGEDAYHLFGTGGEISPMTGGTTLVPSYKSSITINSSSGTTYEMPTTPPPSSPEPARLSTVASKVTLFSSTLPSMKKVSSLSGGGNNANDSSTTTAAAAAGPTIRFLTTTKSGLTKHKKLVAETPNDECRQPTVLTTGAISGKLAAHPYLCRLRASPVECFERRYPKLMKPQALCVSMPAPPPPSSVSPTISLESSSSSTEMTATSTSTTSYQSHHRLNYRIPDIERV